MSIIKQNVGQQTAKIRRRVQFHENGRSWGFTTEDAGTRTAELELVINVDQLVACLREKALTSSGRKTSVQFGSILLRVVKGTEKDQVIPHVHQPRCYKDGVPACGNEGSA